MNAGCALCGAQDIPLVGHSSVCEGECKHGLVWAHCTICNGRDKIEKMNLVEGHPFPAHYEGTCPWCEDSIDVGDNIYRSSRGQYVCEDCGVKFHA